MVRYATVSTSTMIALGNKTAADVTEDDLIYIVALLGHSGQSGGRPVAELLAQPSFPTDFPVPRVKIWDKTKRSNALDDSLTDASRGGEQHQFRDITVGWAGSDIDYPWEGLSADPHFGPELALAGDWYKHKKGTLLIVKHAIAGSQANDVSGAQDWNLLDDSGLSHTEVFLTAYWAPALAAALDMAGGDHTKIRILGISWFQGFSDGRTVPEATAHAGIVHDILTEMRSRMGATVDNDIPILAVNGPLTTDIEGTPLGELATIRAGVEGLETGSGEPQELANCFVFDTQGYPEDPLSLPHFTAVGNEMLGNAYGRFFRAMTGATLTT